MNQTENTAVTTITPAEGLCLAAESAGIALQEIDKALEMVAEQLLELGEDEEAVASITGLHAVLCLVQRSAQNSVKELTQARLDYLHATP